MRKHGWQLPYHPLQVVAMAVFLALGFAFYVFFAPFVGTKLLQILTMAVYTPLLTSVLGLYIWCSAADPADSGVFKSKKYSRVLNKENNVLPKGSTLTAESTSSICDDTNAATVKENPVDKSRLKTEGLLIENEKGEAPSNRTSRLIGLLGLFPCACLCSKLQKEAPDQQINEDGMFYCSLCEVEVSNSSKHCRVCDKCIDRFDHHCRWLNNCIGRRNYRQFFTLMVSALLMLILQWSVGILVLISCFIHRKRYELDITSKLGSSFSLVPFVIVVVLCTILAMIASLPLVQLFFFHILLIQKGISTYDYIIALREQEQIGAGGQQSPQMSPASSLTGLSSASSYTNFNRGAWCTPPRLFLEDQFDVVPPDNASVSSYGKKMAVVEDTCKKRNPGSVKISPWTLARLKSDDVSKAAAEARKKSKILQPIAKRETPSFGQESGSGISTHSRRMVSCPENNRRRGGKRVRLLPDLPIDSSIKHYPNSPEPNEKSTLGLAPLYHEARSVFRTSLAMSSPVGVVSSSPDSSFGSPELHPFRGSSAVGPAGLSGAGVSSVKGVSLSRSTSDGYEASGGEDSDRVPTRLVQRSKNWSGLLLGSDQGTKAMKLKASSSSSQTNEGKP